MSTYISLTNELLRRMGEVVLDSTEFDGARNIQALAKNAVNSSIRELMHGAQEWPFALVTNTQTLTVGEGQYSFPSNTSVVDWESFYLKKLEAADNDPAHLPVLTYTDYLDNHRPREDMNGTGGYGVPTHIYQTQESKFGVTAKPDQAYQIEYKYWSFPADLVESTDVCIVPDRFTSVLLDGAMFYMLMFRSNEQGATIYKEKFDLGIRTMRRLLLDEPMYMRSTIIVAPAFSARVF
jgi:hypothetical protein